MFDINRPQNDSTIRRKLKNFFLLAIVSISMFVLGCAKTATMHQSILDGKSSRVPGEFAKASMYPVAVIIKFKYDVKDGTIQILDTYQQNKVKLANDNEIIAPSKSEVNSARESNVQTMKDQNYLIDYVTVQPDGVYSCPFGISGSDKNVYQGSKYASVFYDVDGAEINDAGKVVGHVVAAPFLLVSTILGDKPKELRQTVSANRINKFGIAVETVALNDIDKKIATLNSAQSLMYLREKYPNYKGIDAAYTRARELDPAYCKAWDAFEKRRLPVAERSAILSSPSAIVDAEKSGKAVFDPRFEVNISARSGYKANQGGGQFVTTLVSVNTLSQNIPVDVRVVGKNEPTVSYPAKITVNYITRICKRAKVSIGAQTLGAKEAFSVEEEKRTYTLSGPNAPLTDEKIIKVYDQGINLFIASSSIETCSDPELYVGVTDVKSIEFSK